MSIFACLGVILYIFRLFCSISSNFGDFSAFLLGFEYFSTPITIVGGVVPHHDLPATLTASWYAQVATASSQVRQIVLIGPQHYPNPAPIIASSNLPSSITVLRDDHLLRQDHAFTSQLPYLEKTWPEATISALLLSNHLNVAQLDNLINDLERSYSPSDTLFLGSIDFSHYLTLEQLEKRDRQMQNWLTADDGPQQIVGLGDEYTDSWASLYLLLTLMRRQQAVLTITGRSNSALLLNDLALGSNTSYFYLTWTK